MVRERTPARSQARAIRAMGVWDGDDETTPSPRDVSRRVGSPSSFRGHPRLRPSNGTGPDVWSIIRPVLNFVLEVAGTTLQTIKRPIAYILAVWILLGVLVMLRNLALTSLQAAISPICRVPGISLLRIPLCQGNNGNAKPVQFDQLLEVQGRFDDILKESAGGVTLPLDMKRGETSIRDLRQVVRFSQLHSRQELVLEFDGFIETARIASYDLQKFNSHVGRGVDNILATARWTKRVLDGIAAQNADRSTGMLGMLGGTVLAPFQPVKLTEKTLSDQYIQHTQVVEEEIQRLVQEAQALLRLLQNLEDRLDVIHGISVRDDVHTQASRAEVLSELWTILGGNRDKLGKYDLQLDLLRQVNTYRQNAIAHVGGTLLKLQGMGAELEELRERVGSVELLKSQTAVSLRMHIDNIELGVERLERGRRGAKEVEDEQMSRSMSRQLVQGNGGLSIEAT